MDNVVSVLDNNLKIREVPHNEMAEQMLLGAILTNNEHLNRVSDFLKAEHFYIPLHQKIYNSINVIIERGIIASPVTLKNYFDNDESIIEIGNKDYLIKLAMLGNTIISVVDYAKTIVDLSLKRKLIEVGEDIVNDAYDYNINETAMQQLEKSEQALFQLSDYGNDGKGGFLHLKETLVKSLSKIQSAFKLKDTVTGISSGFIDLDKLLGGFQNSDLIILAGRPSMGKTAVVVNMAYNAANFLIKKIKTDKENIEKLPSIGIFSMEMSGDQLATRLISMISGISSAKLRNGNINQEDFGKIIAANKELLNLPLFIDDTPALSISSVRTRARRLKRKHNLSLLIIDYLQLIRGASKISEASRVQEISEITMGLKAIAKELDIPVIALSQLSRAVEQREDKRPLLSDLRESGSIEQDADIVMFIYRDDYYLMRKQPKEGTPEFEKWQFEMDKVMNVTELIVAKQRNGPIGNVRIHFDLATTRFCDYSEIKEESYFS